MRSPKGLHIDKEYVQSLCPGTFLLTGVGNMRNNRQKRLRRNSQRGRRKTKRERCRS